MICVNLYLLHVLILHVPALHHQSPGFLFGSKREKSPKDKKEKEKKLKAHDTSTESATTEKGGPPAGSPQLPGYTREYDYDASDDQASPRKPFTRGFSYENQQSPTSLTSDPESQQSPSTKRATGLAFNYAPGEEGRLKKEALKAPGKPGFKDPKSDTAAFLAGEQYTHEKPVERASSPTKTGYPVPHLIPAKKTRPVKLFVITGKKDPKTGRIILENASVDTSTGSQNIDTDLIESKYGLIDPSNGTVIITDPSNGQKEVVQGYVDPVTKQIIITSGFVLDPKTGKKDSTLGQIISIAEQQHTHPASPLAVVPKKRIVKLSIVTAKRDPKTDRVEAEKGYTENVEGVLHPVSGHIETKYGVIDPLNKKIVSRDPKTNKTEIRALEVDENLGQFIVKEGVVDPKTGKVDQTLGQLITVEEKVDSVVPITSVIAKRDAQTGQLDPTQAHKEVSNGKIDTKNGLIITKYGSIDVKNKKIISYDPKTRKVEERPIQLDAQDNIIILSGVVNPSTGLKDNNFSQILQVGSEVDPEVQIVSASGKVDSKKGLDPKHATTEESAGLYDPDTDKIYTKYGVFDPVRETLTYTDPKSGKTEVKQGQRDAYSGDVLFKGLVNPKTGKVDSSYGRTIKVVAKNPSVDAAVERQPLSTKDIPKDVALAPVAAAPAVPSKDSRVIKIMLLTAKKDPKTGNLDIDETATVTQSTAILNPSGEIYSEYGLIDPKKGTITITDPTTLKEEVIQGKVDPASGQILFTDAPVKNPKTGKRDETLGQIIAIVSDKTPESAEKVKNALPSHPIPKRRVIKVLVITSRKDPKSGKVDAEKGTVEKITATVDPVSGIIESKYGKIDPQNNKIIQKDPKSGKPLVSSITVDEQTGQIYVSSNVIDQKTGKVDPDLSQVINIVDPQYPVVVITTVKAKKDPNTGTIDLKNTQTEKSSGRIIPETGEIVTKHGTVNLKLFKITSRDPKTGQVSERPVYVDKDDNIVVTSGVKDPNTGTVDPNWVQLIQVGNEIDPEVQVTSYVGKVDAKKNTIDSKNATPYTTPGLYDPDKNKIYTKYGQLDPVEETLTVLDPKTGKWESRQGHIEPNTGELVFKGGFKNPKTGKIDPHYGRAISVHITEPVIESLVTQQPTEKDETATVAAPVSPSKTSTLPSQASLPVQIAPKTGEDRPIPKHRVVKIMVITAKKDPKTKQIDIENGQIEHLSGILDPNTGFIETKYGLIDPKTGNLIRRDTATGQLETIEGKVDPITGQVHVVGGAVIDPKTGKPDASLGQVFSVVGLKQAQDPNAAPIPKKRVIKITVVTTKIDPKTGKVDFDKGQVEQSTALLNPDTGLIESKYGLIDPKNGKLIVNDPKSGKVDAKLAQVNEANGQIIIASGVTDPKTGKVDTSLGQVISLAGQNDPIVEITTITSKNGDVNSGQMENSKAKKISANGEIVTKYGKINLHLLRITTVDPKTGKETSRPIEVDANGNIHIKTGVVDPKTDKVNPELSQIIKVGSEVEPEVQILSFMGKLDPKKNTMDTKSLSPEISAGLYNPNTHKIDTKYGQIDPVNGTLTYIDPRTGKQEIKQGIIEPTTGQVIFKGYINPKTGKIDPNYGRIVNVLVSNPQIDEKGQVLERNVKSVKIDTKSNQVWVYDQHDPITKQDVFVSGQIDPVTGYIVTVYGTVDPKSGNVVNAAKVDPSNVKVDPETNQVYTKTSETDENGAPIYAVSEIDPKNGEIYTKYGKVDPKTGKFAVIKIYILTQSDPSGKVKEINPKDCQIDEKTGKIINVTTQTVYMYSMVDPKTGKVIQVDPNDPLVKSANTKVTQVLTLSGEIDPITGKIHTEWGNIDPQTGDIDPKTARKDPVTGELILNYAQIDPSHFKHLKDTKVKVKTYSKSGDESSSEAETSDDDLNEYATDNLQDLSNLKIPKDKKGASTPVIVKTTTKQVVTKDRDGLTQNIEEKVEDGRTGEVTFSTQVNKVCIL